MGLGVLPGSPAPAGKKKAERYLLVACTELYTHYLLGDRSMDTFKTFVVQDLTNSVIVHDRYQNYDSAKLGTLVHQLCCAHLLRDLADAAQVYPDAVWPTQIADALRSLIHQATPAREAGLPAIATDIRDELLGRFRHGMLAGLSDTTSHGTRPGERKARLLLEVLRDRPHDVLRFAPNLTVPPHLQPGRTRPTPQQNPAKDLRAADQRGSHPGPLHHPGLPVDRRQTRPQQDHRPARRTNRPTLNARTTRTHLTTSRPTTTRPTGRPPANRRQHHALIIRAECLPPMASS
ncbi:MAG: IS66 family transposase [Pseudonocardiaceae bacterium]